MGYADDLVERARKLNKKIVLPETEDDRTLQAAERIVKENVARVVLIGNREKVIADAKKVGADVTACEILDPADDKLALPLAEKLFEYRKAKGVTIEQAKELVRSYLYFGTMLLKEGSVDGYVAGATHTTGDNLRPALQIIKAAAGIKTVSSFFMMIHPNTKFGENGVMLYADCGMNEMPNSEQLADIALASATSWKQLVGTEPRIAMLSYSTKGSAKSADTEKVIKALEIVKNVAPNLMIDGEMQVDAALIESVASRIVCGMMRTSNFEEFCTNWMNVVSSLKYPSSSISDTFGHIAIYFSGNVL